MHASSRAAMEASREALRHAIAAVARQPLGPGLMQGFTGVAWTIAHLADSAAPGAADAALTDMLRRDAWRGTYDLVGGLVGMGIYALERGSQGIELLACVGVAPQRFGSCVEFRPLSAGGRQVIA